MATAEGRGDAVADVAMLFPVYVGVIRPQPLPEGVAGPPEPERVVVINPLTQSMVVLPSWVASQRGEEHVQEDEETRGDQAAGSFHAFASLMREVMMMSATEDRPGPPPASKASIQALKTVEGELLARDQECAVCLEGLAAVADEQQTADEEEKDAANTTATPHEDEETSMVAASCTGGAALVVKEMPCGHRYHRNCIETWLRVHGSCPVCRHRMPEEEQEEEPPNKPTGAVPVLEI